MTLCKTRVKKHVECEQKMEMQKRFSVYTHFRKLRPPSKRAVTLRAKKGLEPEFNTIGVLLKKFCATHMNKYASTETGKSRLFRGVNLCSLNSRSKKSTFGNGGAYNGTVLSVEPTRNRIKCLLQGPLNYII